MRPGKYLNPERIVILGVQMKRLEIDESGNAWRVFSYVKRRKRADRPIGGYRVVHLTLNGRRWTAMLNRLVWQHFHGDIPDGMAVTHIDGDRNNNRLSNLQLTAFHGNANSFAPGPDHLFRWSGGRRIDVAGYVRVWVPEGFEGRMADGTVLEHRLVAEAKIGRRLQQDEVAHHVDENKKNNHPDNIEVLTNSLHVSYHQKRRLSRLRKERSE